MKTSIHWFTNMLAVVIGGACLLNASAVRAEPTSSPLDGIDSTNQVAQTIAKLNLTEDQKTKVEPILQAGFKKQHAILESFRDQPHNRGTLRSLRSQMRATEKETADKLKPILTDQQMKQYQDIRQQMNAQLRQEIRSYRGNSE